jgi:CheY-like chemotaxis protein
MAPKDLVLCVDDEPTLLRTCIAAVQRVGFRAEAVQDGAAGLTLFLERRDEICLVLTDIIMPGMNGIDMAERILQVEPKVKILLMSAYSESSDWAARSPPSVPAHSQALQLREAD